MIDIEILPQLVQDIYQRLMVDADDVGLALDDIMMYVQEFDMDEDMLSSFIEDKIEETKENKNVQKGKKMMESLKRALRY